jgi:quercetin dioxygenase-like cupin family protein
MQDPQTEPQAQSFPIARIDLDEEIQRMRASPRQADRLAKTLVRNRNLRAVLMILDRGAKLPEHRADGSLAIQVVQGRVVVTVLGSTVDLAAGELLAIERDVTHAVIAIEDSALLLTIGWPG